MSEDVLVKFSWDEHFERTRKLRELDIYISEYLWNLPCVGYGYIDNEDGCPLVRTDLQHPWGDPRFKEPLYKTSEPYPYLENFEVYLENEKKYIDHYPNEEEFLKSKTKDWEEEIINGIHVDNLKEIPEYSTDLNLIHRCEEKLLELGYDMNKYSTEHLQNILHHYKIFDVVHASAEVRAQAIVQMLKDKNEHE